MNHKHTPLTKRLGSLRLHWFAFEEALTSAKSALDYKQRGSKADLRTARSLSLQAITAYARPFTHCEGVSSPKSPGNTALCDLRDQVTGHTDALKHEYTTKVSIENGKAVNKSFVTDLLPFMEEVIRESTKELERTAKEITSLEARIITEKLADGDYE